MIWIPITVAVVIGLGIFFAVLKRSQDLLESNFQEKFSEADIRAVDKSALYVARLSDGYSHFRGAGYLVLTDEELYFERRLTNKIITVPTSAIAFALFSAGRSMAARMAIMAITTRSSIKVNFFFMRQFIS